MNTGLVIGKFMPLHQGHCALIDFALEQCGQVIVLVHDDDRHPIPGTLRLKWLWEMYRHQTWVQIEYVKEASLPDSSVPDREISRIWGEYLSRRFPEARTIITSEKYGDYVAETMGIRHILFDPGRTSVPVSGTLIRENPYQHWEYLTPPARSWYRKKVCVYGPESTGKSTLAGNLAKYFKSIAVPEMARVILGERHVVYDDFPVIFEKHAEAVIRYQVHSGPVLFVDTDHLTTRIYAEHYFRKVPEYPLWVENANQYDLYLFCDTDVPWVADVQRDSENFRDEHRTRFQKELNDRGIPFVLISGDWDERFHKAVDAVNRLLMDL